MGKALARRVKCLILYATETGKSERFAETLCEIFKHAFDAKVSYAIGNIRTYKDLILDFKANVYSPLGYQIL